MADLPDGVTHDVAIAAVALEILKATRLSCSFPNGVKPEEYLVTVTNDYIKIKNALENNKPLEE